MKTIRSLFLALVAGMLFSASRAPADTPQLEFSAGYTYLHLDAHSGAPNFPLTVNFNKSGYDLQAEWRTNRWLGLVGDVGEYSDSLRFNGFGAISYLIGPRVHLRAGRLQPFAHVLVGGLLSDDGLVDANSRTNCFATAIGAGLDYKVSRHFALRPLQADYFLTTLRDDLDNRQNSLRLSAGVVLRLGEK